LPIKALLKDNPNVVFKKEAAGWTPLHYAAHWGHKDVAELLLANRAEVSAQDNEGMTPLHFAADGGLKEMFELLLSGNADANSSDKDGMTPLRWAMSKGHHILLLVGLSVTNGPAQPSANTSSRRFPLPPDVKLLKDLEYGRADGRPMRLDLFVPEKGQKPLPLLIWIHVGAWMSGSKDDPSPALRFTIS
jgi:ankyrin repeat protein